MSVNGIKQPFAEPAKKVEDMTPEELREYINSLNDNTMGFDGEEEGVEDA